METFICDACGNDTNADDSVHWDTGDDVFVFCPECAYSAEYGEMPTFEEMLEMEMRSEY